MEYQRLASITRTPLLQKSTVKEIIFVPAPPRTLLHHPITSVMAPEKPTTRILSPELLHLHSTLMAVQTAIYAGTIPNNAHLDLINDHIQNSLLRTTAGQR